MTSLGLNMFTDDELWEVHLATLDVLWNVGVKVEKVKEAREILQESVVPLMRILISLKSLLSS